MPFTKILTAEGADGGKVDLAESLFDAPINESLIHQAVIRQLAGRRLGTSNTLTRGMVNGGGKKPWRQKGTGRARQGTKTAPQWAGGGVVFGPHPRSYHKDFPRKMRRLAMKSALSARVAESALTLVDELALPAAKTREVAGVLKALGLQRGALIVVAEADEAVSRASRNLEDVRTVTPGGLNLLDLLMYRHVIMTKPAVQALTAQLLKQIGRGGEVAEVDSASVPMEEAAASKAEAGAPADVAVADAAAQVASTDEDLKEES